MALAHDQFMTAEAFLEWHQHQNERYELIEGRPVKMMVGALARHVFATNNIDRCLGPQVRKNGCHSATSDFAVRTNTHQVRYPDVVVDCGTSDLDSLEAQQPRLIGEVLSGGTEYFDTHDKLREYQAIDGLWYILIVSPKVRRVDFYARSENGDWECTILLEVEDEIDLPKIGASLPLAAIYEAIDPEPWVPIEERKRASR